jgi:hypothetical protein
LSRESGCGTLARMLRTGLWLGLVATLTTFGCAYPRRTTPLATVPPELARNAQAPASIWRFVLVRADIPPHKRSGLSWDEGHGPDAYLRFLVAGEEIWRSPVVENSIHPVFEASPPKNFAFSPDTRVRLELWDKDGVTADPIGIYEGRGLGQAVMGAPTTLKLEGGATLTVKIDRPVPHFGSGIALYEKRRQALLVLKVVPNSPAARAGLKAGDRITAIAGKLIDDLEQGQAESALTQAGQRGSELTVERAGTYRRIKLDDGYVWLTM